MRSGDLLVFEGSTCFSKCVQWFTNSSISHVALLVETMEKMMVWEAYLDPPQSWGVTLRPLDEVLREYQGTISYQPLIYQRPMDFDSILFTEIEELRTIRFDKSFHLLPGEPNQTTAEFHCSALVAYQYTRWGLLPESYPWSTTFPTQIANADLQRGARFGARVLLKR